MGDPATTRTRLEARRSLTTAMGSPTLQVHLVPTPGLPLPMRESTTLSVESPSTVLWATSRPLLRSPTTVENFDRRISNWQIKHHSKKKNPPKKKKKKKKKK